MAPTTDFGGRMELRARRIALRASLGTLALLLLAVAPIDRWQGSGTPSPRARAQGSNVLFVLTDDMRLDELQYMPHVRQLVAEQGMSFDSEFDNVTLCCPARASILRGQYSHNTGVLTNGGENGGFESAYSSHLEASTIATAMHDAGYATGLLGQRVQRKPVQRVQLHPQPEWEPGSPRPRSGRLRHRRLRSLDRVVHLG